MPQTQSYKVIARTIDGRSWVSRLNTTVVPDDMSPEQIAEAIDNSIMGMWHQTLANNQPFQFGFLEADTNGQMLTSLIVHPRHVVWLRLVMRELRPATPEEVAANAPAVMPEIRFDQTEQPLTEG